MGRPKKQAPATGHKILSVDGVVDIINDTDQLWATVFTQFQKISATYGFSRVRTSFLEDIELYRAYVQPSDELTEHLVKAQVGNSEWALRPELLPSLLRAYIQRKIYETSPSNKWVTEGAVIKLDDKGGVVTDQQFVFEVLGQFNHLTEAQVIGAVWQLICGLGISESVTLEINHIGTVESRDAYSSALADYLKGKKFDLCDSCTELLSVRPLGVLRCQKVDCQAVVADAPTVLDFLDQGSHKHFTCILEALDELVIPYQLNPLYAGDYGASKTNVSIWYRGSGKSVLLAEGAYHDQLLERFSGKKLSSFGVSGSLSALHKVLQASQAELQPEQKSEVFLVPLGELAARKSLRLFQDLTRAQVIVYDNFGTAGVKDQLKAAQAFKSPIALIMGQKEAMDEMVILRDVKSGMQEVFSYDKIVDEVKKRLGH